MDKSNDLAKNLRFYKEMRNETLAEFSAELGIPRSTIRSILDDGNTTVDTLVRLHNATHVSLDDLVFGEHPMKVLNDAPLDALKWFVALPPERQHKILLCLNTLLELILNKD